MKAIERIHGVSAIIDAAIGEHRLGCEVTDLQHFSSNEYTVGVRGTLDDAARLVTALQHCPALHDVQLMTDNDDGVHDLLLTADQDFDYPR